MFATNINIKRDRKKLIYGVEYVDDSWETDQSFAGYLDVSDESDAFQFITSDSYNCVRATNEWSTEVKYIPSGLLFAGMPQEFGVSSFNIYFPQHSVETFDKNFCYCAEFTTYINGDKIILGCFIIDRRDAKAYPGTKEISGNRYYEYVKVNVPDPWDIVYSDAWSTFRRDICHEPQNINNTGSLITIEMNPVTWNGEKWTKTSSYSGGSNSIIIEKDDSDYLSPILYIKEDEDDHTEKLFLEFKYNTTFASLSEYIKETYQTGDTVDARTSIILHDEESVYNYYYLRGANDLYKIRVDSPSQNIPFDGWTGTDEQGKTIEYWKPGLMFTAVFTIYKDEEPAVSIKSNSLPLTKENFSCLIARPAGIPASIDLDSIEDLDIVINGQKMTDINVVNKIERKIVNIQRPSEAQNSISRPVFVRVYDEAQDLNIHPSVTENIGVNLQKYKSSVKRFTIKIAGTEFPESGRIGTNVVFKLNGGSIPGDAASGIYYILDDNKELVTFGNYNVQ